MWVEKGEWETGKILKGYRRNLGVIMCSMGNCGRTLTTEGSWRGTIRFSFLQKKFKGWWMDLRD